MIIACPSGSGIISLPQRKAVIWRSNQRCVGNESLTVTERSASWLVRYWQRSMKRGRSRTGIRKSSKTCPICCSCMQPREREAIYFFFGFSSPQGGFLTKYVSQRLDCWDKGENPKPSTGSEAAQKPSEIERSHARPVLVYPERLSNNSIEHGNIIWQPCPAIV